MEYQLVLQFRGDALEDYDAMIALENALIEALRGSAKVDGHDGGSGEVNIFIFTDQPKQTFQKAWLVLEKRGGLDSVTAAFRSVGGADYTVIWPEQSKQEFKIA
jgi:ribosomal 30S subunit maturation factor RimM